MEFRAASSKRGSESKFSLPYIHRVESYIHSKSKAKRLPILQLSNKFTKASAFPLPINHSSRRFQSVGKIQKFIPRRILVYNNEYNSTPDKSNCFLHKFTNSEISTRLSRHIELDIFYEICQRNFQSSEKYKYLYTSNGKRIVDFNRIEDSDQYLVVRQEVWSDIQKSSLINLKNKRQKSSEIRTNRSKQNLLGDSFLTKLNESTDSKVKGSTLKFLKKTNKEKLMLDLKLKLGEAAVLVDSKLPKLNDLGIKFLSKKYNFKESTLQGLYARFKLLVMLSFSTKPNHDIQKGIEKSVFIESFVRASDSSKLILEKICAAIELNSNDCIDLNEYLQAMSILTNGNQGEQIDMFFSVYDTDGNGSLSFGEIKDLCRLQLYFAQSDGIIDYLAESFASLIFDMAGLKYDQEITAGKLKSVIEATPDKFIVEMFCSFNCLTN